MSSTSLTQTSLSKMKDWELVALKTEKADHELKIQCQAVAKRYCEPTFVEGPLRPEQYRIIDDMKESRRWLEEVERRGNPKPHGLNRPDDLALTFSESGEPIFYRRMLVELERLAVANSRMRALSEEDREYVVHLILQRFLSVKRKYITPWLLAIPPEDRGTACIGYIRSSALELAGEVLRRRANKPEMKSLSEPLPSGEAAEVPDKASLEKDLISQEQGRLLGEAMAQLEAVDREIIWLVLNGLSYEEIAKQLGISKDAARARFSRAVRRLSVATNSTSLSNSTTTCEIF